MHFFSGGRNDEFSTVSRGGASCSLSSRESSRVPGLLLFWAGFISLPRANPAPRNTAQRVVRVLTIELARSGEELASAVCVGDANDSVRRIRLNTWARFRVDYALLGIACRPRNAPAQSNHGSPVLRSAGDISENDTIHATEGICRYSDAAAALIRQRGTLKWACLFLASLCIGLRYLLGRFGRVPLLASGALFATCGIVGLAGLTRWIALINFSWAQWHWA